LRGNCAHLVNFPNLNEEPHKDTHSNHKVGVVVENVEEHDEGLEDAKNNGTDRETLQTLSIIPKLNV
jgi:hypothetical protein